MILGVHTLDALRSSLAMPLSNAGGIFNSLKGNSSKRCRLVPPTPKSPMDSLHPIIRKRSKPVTWALSVFGRRWCPGSGCASCWT